MTYTIHCLTKRYLAISFLMFFFVLIVGSDVLAGNASVKIKIEKELVDKNEPVKNVECKLVNVSKDEVFEKKSNKRGVCEFKSISKGKYVLYLHSSKFREENSEWALPIMNKVVEINVGKNVFNIKCRKEAIVKGNLNYQGEGSIEKAFIYTWSGQKNTSPNKNGEFTLRGLHPDKNGEIIILLAGVDPSYFPVYKRVVEVNKKKLKEGKVTDIGSIYFPKAKKNETVRLVVSDKNGSKLNSYRLKNNRYSGLDLIIKNSDGTIIFSGVLSTLDKIKRKTSGDGAKIRLPSGKYKAWWRGYKDKKIYSFKITEKTQPTLKVKLPDK